MTRKYTEPSGAYGVAIPRDWEFSLGKSALAIFRSVDGVGAINVSSFVKTPLAPAQASSIMREILAGHRIDAEPQPIALSNAANAAFVQYEKGDFWWRAWIIVIGNRVVYATYNCRQSHKGEEDASVDEIVASIRDPENDPDSGKGDPEKGCESV